MYDRPIVPSKWKHSCWQVLTPSVSATGMDIVLRVQRSAASGLELLAMIVEIYNNYTWKTEVLAATFAIDSRYRSGVHRCGCRHDALQGDAAI